MRSPGEQHRQPEGGPDAPAPGRPAGLLEKLMAVIRPEFRHDELVFDPQDPVFGGPVCQVPGCRRPGRSVGMCTAHHLRWSHAGKPSLDRFAAATSPGFAPPPLARCQAPGCGHGVAQNGLCPWHRGAWKRAGYPDLRQWLAGLPAVELTSLPPACPVPDCELWVQGSTPFCWRHGRHWISRGRPAVSEFIASSHRQETLPAYERIDLRPLEPQLKLEMQYDAAATTRRSRPGPAPSAASCASSPPAA